MPVTYGICQRGQNELIMPCFASAKPIFSATRQISREASELSIIVACAFLPSILAFTDKLNLNPATILLYALWSKNTVTINAATLKDAFFGFNAAIINKPPVFVKRFLGFLASFLVQRQSWNYLENRV